MKTKHLTNREHLCIIADQQHNNTQVQYLTNYIERTNRGITKNGQH